MRRGRGRREIGSITEAFIDPLFGAFGAFLFLFLMVLLIMGLRVVSQEPQILTERLPPAYSGVSYHVALAAREGMGAYTWRKRTGELPQGITLGPDGRLAGTPQLPLSEGSERGYRFVAEVRSERMPDARPQERGFELLLLREAPAEALRVKPVEIVSRPQLPPAPRGAPYTLTLAVSGGIPPYRWRLREGALPEGLDLSEEGVLSGEPRKEGDFTLSVEVRDSRTPGTDGGAAAAVLALAVVPVHPPPHPLRILSNRLPDGIVGQPYSAALSADGGYPPYRWEVAGLPAGLTLDPVANLLRGSPQGRGGHLVTLAVVDERGGRARLPLPVPIQVREGEIVRWWKVFAFLLLYLGYQLFVGLFDWIASRVQGRLQRTWGIELIIGPDGTTSAADPHGGQGAELLGRALDTLHGCTGGSNHVSALLAAARSLLRFEIIKALMNLGLLRIIFALQGVVLFFYVSREEIRLWPELASAPLLLWMLVLVGSALATLGRRPPRPGYWRSMP